MDFDIDVYLNRMGDGDGTGHRPMRVIKNTEFSTNRRFWGSIPSIHVAGKHSPAIPEWKGPGRYQWFYSDNKFKWKENLKHHKKDLRRNKWIMEEDIPFEVNYRINQFGFRHDGSFNDYKDVQGGVIWLGDSNVFGTGLNFQYNYTNIAHHSYERFKDLPYVNMGFPASGIETHYRLLKLHIEHLKPKYVIHQFPWIWTRAEHYAPMWDAFFHTSSSREIKAIEDEENEDLIYWKADRMLQLLSTPTGVLRYNVNLDALKWICHQHDAKFISIEEDEGDLEKDKLVAKFNNSHEDFARDLNHAGVETNAHNAEVLKEVLDYCLHKYS